MRHTYAATITLALAPACGLELGWGDPCDPTNPTHPHLSADQQDACSLCGQIDCSGETGETGDTDEPGDDEQLVCSSGGEGMGMSFCALASTAVGGFDMAHYYETSVGSCTSTSAPFPHVPNWWTPVDDGYSGRKDMWCDPVKDYGHANAGSSWYLCENPATADNDQYPGHQPFYPATRYNDIVSSSTWTYDAECVEYTDERSICVRGMVAIGDDSVGGWADSPYRPETWTCSCLSDHDCPGQTVCEAGWTVDGYLPKPTLCTWDDGSGTSNGIAPEGPVVYGGESWSDVVDVRGADVTVYVDGSLDLRTGLRAFIERALNDDQRFGLVGELTYCGERALCSHLGMDVGDSVEISQAQYDALVEGRTVDLVLRRVDGTASVRSVTLTPR